MSELGSSMSSENFPKKNFCKKKFKDFAPKFKNYKEFYHSSYSQAYSPSFISDYERMNNLTEDDFTRQTIEDLMARKECLERSYHQLSEF